MKATNTKLWLAFGFSVLAFSSASRAQKADQQYTRSVAEISQQIATVAAQLNEQKTRLKTAQDQLLFTERSELGVRNKISSIKQKAKSIRDQIKRLTEEIKQSDNQIEESRVALRSLIQNRHRNGLNSYAKLVLNQQNPYAVGRLNNYNEYFALAMKERIDSITKLAANSRQLRHQLVESERAISEESEKLENQQKALQKTKQDRAKLIQQLDQEVSESSDKLKRLEADRKRLNKLIQQVAKKAAELRKAEQRRREAAEKTEKTGPKQTRRQRQAVPGGFTKQKGRLAYPSTGRQQRKFGSRVAATGMTSDGIFFATQESAPVSAIFRGRVLFADFLKGYGLLLIIDHGDEHISLYGHNEVLYKSVGDSVETGEIVSRSGMTGGLKSPGLYFEIRKNANPINPALWCRK